MLVKKVSVYLTLCLLTLGITFAVPAFAGSAVVGSVAGSTNATLGGLTVLPNTTLFSGDVLQVKNGVAMVTLGNSSHVAFGRDTVASFLRDSNEVTVLLSQGSVSVFHAEDATGVRVKVGDVSVVPVSGFKTLGEVATLNGAMIVTAKEGMLRVEGNGQVVNVAKGKTITVYPNASAPQQGSGGTNGPYHHSSYWWGPVGGIVGGAGLIVAGIGLSRADNAMDNAASAASAAAAAASAAAAALSAAEAAASAAAAEANSIGCALNVLAGEEGKASPYTPPAGYSCPSS
ncbi:MAG: hypothetical protein ABSE93_09510 [Terriglobia bacterium]|jgi:hypothetical protein